MNKKSADTYFSCANAAYRNKQFSLAIRHYVESLMAEPGLQTFIFTNLALARHKFCKERQADAQWKVAVCGCTLSSDKAGRVDTLAKLYNVFSKVEIINVHIREGEYKAWQSASGVAMPVHGFIFDKETDFIAQALKLIIDHPYDLVHLNNPYMPNILVGLLYKLVWGAKILIDIDDEKLMPVSGRQLTDLLQAHQEQPDPDQLTNKTWTQIGAGLAQSFDGVTVTNQTLQQAYGGKIIRPEQDKELANMVHTVLLGQNLLSPKLGPVLQQLVGQATFAPLLPALLGNKTAQLISTPIRKEIPTCPVTTTGKSNEEIIQLAGQANAQGEWSEAYAYWMSLLARPDRELSISLLLQISRELFQLDAFPDAATALERAARQDANHPIVIGEQANQYYYHCYSSWLMLVTENEPDWYKADGLKKRPDWQTACELIEKAEKTAPRNNLRRYVQAYLLLAEEAWDQQQRTQAHAALQTALDAIGPKKISPSLNQAVFQAVDRFRDNDDNNSQALEEQIKSIPTELLDVQDWLCFNDILNWNGLLLCGYVAREKAVDLAIEQGKAQPDDKEILKTALKAALDRGDAILASEFLARLKVVSPQAIDVRELEACCFLHQGNLPAFRAAWPHPPKPVDLRFREYLKGKRVAIVGPAPTSTLDGEEIDSYDVVVRMNWRGPKSMPDAKEFGRRTDVSLYNAHTIRLLDTHKSFDILKPLSFNLIRRPHYRKIVDKTFRIIADYPANFHKSMNAVPALTFDIALHDIENLNVLKVNFYLSRSHHNDNYRNGEKTDNKKQITKLQPILANHDLAGQIGFVKLITNSSQSITCRTDIPWDINQYYLTLVNNFFPELRQTGLLDKNYKTIIYFVETPLHYKLAKRIINFSPAYTHKIIYLEKIHKELASAILNDSDSQILSINISKSSSINSAISSLESWLIKENYDFFINFNDGTNSTIRIIKKIPESKIITIQDGYLGHVKKHDKVFDKIHKRNITSKNLYSAILVSENKKILDIYKHTIYKNKIGISQKGRYIFSDKDTLLKSSIIHRLNPSNIYCGVWPKSNPEKSNPAKNKHEKGSIVIIGQCHSHHGHLKKQDHLKNIDSILSNLSDIDISTVYRFHPGEPEDIRKSISKTAHKRKIKLQYPETDKLILKKEDICIIESSSLVFDMLKKHIKTVVLEWPENNMRLPRIKSEFITYAEISDLREIIQMLIYNIPIGSAAINTGYLPEDFFDGNNYIPDLIKHLLSIEMK